MDISHFYLERGAGEPLILLHGNGEDSSYFFNQMDAFSAAYHVFALDTRGHGKTERGSAPFTIRQFADDLLSFMDSYALDKANILGFSDGANIAMIFAIKYPSRVNKLILNGGNLNTGGIKAATQIPIEIGYKIANAFAKKSPSAKANAEMLGLMVNDPNISLEELKKIQAPVLVIAGTKDMVKENHTRLIAESIGTAELKFIKGNHFVANKNPSEFNDAVLKFLRQ